MKQCIEYLREKSRRELESTLFKLLIILAHSQSEWRSAVFPCDRTKLPEHHFLAVAYAARSSFPTTLADVSSAPHTLWLEAETKKRPGTRVLVCRPRF